MELTLLSFLLYISAAVSESPFACQSTTVRPGNGLPYYEIIHNEKTFSEAENECRSKGAELYTIREGDSFMEEVIKDISKSWISAKQRYWIHDGLALGLAFESWAAGHPTDDSQRCAYVAQNDSTAKLYSAQCTTRQKTICVKDDLGHCKGENIYEYQCYFTPEGADSYKTFDDSKMACAAESGHLVAIFNQAQMEWISNRFGSPFWSGYKYNGSRTDLFWYDGKPVTNADWADDDSAEGACVVIDDEGKWKMENCEKRNRFVCILEVPYATRNTDCKQYDDECVCYWKGKTRANFDEAMEYCLSDGGTLGYPDNEEKNSFYSTMPASYLTYLLGISSGHTEGVYRGTDASVIRWPNWRLSYGPGNFPRYKCVIWRYDGLGDKSCLTNSNYYCQSLPATFFSGCSKESGCLRTLDYWDLEDVDQVYTGTSELTIKNVKTFDICWDMCVTYIGFTCLVITYNFRSRECSLSSEIKEMWSEDYQQRSRLRKRRVIDPSSYCLDNLEVSLTFNDAVEKCANYKSGWKIPVITDETMINLIAHYSWISAKDSSSMPRVYKTLDGDYLPYSRWRDYITAPVRARCVYVNDGFMSGGDCGTSKNVQCFARLDELCRHSPNITHGTKQVNATSGDLLYTCDDGYVMPNRTISSLVITCACDWSTALEQLENCSLIQCTPPVDNRLGTVANKTGYDINDTVTYKCPLGYRVAETGSIYYTLTCTHVADRVTGDWSTPPKLEAINCSIDPYLPNASYSMNSRSLGTVIEVVCNSWHWIPQLASNISNSTCVLDKSGLFAIWCWVPPCEEITCPEPPDVAMATYQVQGRRTIYTCRPNYRIRGASTNTTEVFCEYDEKFNATWRQIPSCEAITCSDIPRVERASVISSPVDDHLGAVITYQCEESLAVYQDGQQMEYRNQFNKTCDIDYDTLTGNWSGNYSCEVAECAVPPELPHSNLSFTANTVGSIANYTCHSNYIINSTGMKWTTSLCSFGEDGIVPYWTAAENCSAIQCQDPDNVTHAIILSSSTSIGDFTRYSCTEGYKVKDAEPATTRFQIKCELDESGTSAKWSENSTCEVIRCPEAENLTNAITFSSLTNVGAYAQYNCVTGYRVVNREPPTTSFHIACELDDSRLSASWSEAPMCEAVRCLEPPAVSNSEVVVMGYNVGDAAVYTCQGHYVVSADGDVSVGRRTWQSTCVLDDTDVLSAVWKPIEECTGARLTTTPRLEIIDDRILIRQCQPTSSKIGILTVSHHLYTHSAVCYVTRPGYFLPNGGRARSSICLPGGHWTSRDFIVERNRCPPLPNISGATKSTDDNYVGTQVKIKCIDEMAKMENGLSSVTIRCSYNKRWTFIPTTCEVERCGPFELVENARLVAYNNSVDGLATIKCHNSYRFADGARTKAFRCLASLSWQPRERCYLNVCPQLQPLENGLLSTDIAIEGTVVEMKCLPGFVFPDRKTTKFITCNSSFLWSDLPEYCQDIRCPEPPKITYGNKTSTDRLYNSTVTYTCHGSYRLQYGYQQTTIRCGENAEWTYSKLSCGDDRCPPVKSVENATPSTYLAINGTIVIYTCNEGYIFPNNETTLAIYCDGEKWNNTARACIKVICPELHLTHAITYGNGRSFGDVITFECYEGYVYNNNISGVLRCTANARWSTDTDGCTAVDCGAPPEVTYSIHYIPPSHHYGTNITYRCISNYWFKRGTTTKVITCTRYAKWSDIPGHCTPITCHPIPIWNDLEANTTQNVVGTVASVRCTRDDVNRTIISTCSDNGEWEPPLDNCKTETIGVFEPEPEEATGAGGIGLIVTGVMVLLCTVLVISDAQAIIQALKGQALKNNSRNNH